MVEDAGDLVERAPPDDSGAHVLGNAPADSKVAVDDDVEIVLDVGRQRFQQARVPPIVRCLAHVTLILFRDYTTTIVRE